MRESSDYAKSIEFGKNYGSEEHPMMYFTLTRTMAGECAISNNPTG